MPTRNATTGHAPTASGAKIVTISIDSAEAFLARVDERGPELIDVALGAVQDDGTLIGVGVLGAAVGDHAPAIVAVARERRRLKVGSDVLHALLSEAGRRNLRRLHVSYPSAAAADALIRGSGAIAARRVANGAVTAILIVPDRA